MKLIEIPCESIRAPDWNPNQVDASTKSRLMSSVERYGMVVPLVVRAAGDSSFETVGGAHRLEVAVELGFVNVSCVVVEVNDSDAMLLSQALNRIHGQDDLGLRAESVRRILEDTPASEVLKLLPETAGSLKSLTQIGAGDLAKSLQSWETAKKARLHHITLQLTTEQLEVVEAALRLALPEISDSTASPNRKGTAIYEICKSFIDQRG